MSNLRPHSLLIGLLVPSLLCSASCHSERGKRAAEHAAPRAAQPLAKKLCEALHLLPAQRKADCCGTPPQRLLVDECTEAVSSALDRGALELAPGAVDACVASVRDALSGCDWVAPGQPLAPPACQRLFRGRVPAGSTCRSSLECAGNLHCEGTTPTKTGVCTPPAGVGAACGTHVDTLATYTLTRDLEHSQPFCADFCDLVSHKCVRSPPAGAPCAASVNCAAGQSCVRGACSAARRRQLGQSCEAAVCDEGLRCHEGECRELSRTGEACRTDFDCAAGGCIATSSGNATCGAKCSVSLALLKSGSGPGMRLPLRPRPETAPTR